MKGLSLWEPWASLMAAGAKGNETRSWPTKHRGPLAICAAKHWDRDCEEMLARKEVQNALIPLYIPTHSRSGFKITKSMLPFGRVLCIVYVTECIPTRFIKSNWSEHIIIPEPFEHLFGNYEDGRYAWVTDKAKLFKLPQPGPVRGGQRIFNLSPEIERRVRLQWKEIP